MKNLFLTILVLLVCSFVTAETPSSLKKTYGQITYSDDRTFYASGTLSTLAASVTFTVDIPQNHCSIIVNDGLAASVYTRIFNYEDGVALTSPSWRLIFELRNGESLNIPLELPLNTQVRIVATTGTGTYRYSAIGRRNYKDGAVASGWTK